MNEGGQEGGQRAPPHGASTGARIVVALTLIGCWLTFLAPLSALAAMFAAGGLVAAAALVQLLVEVAKRPTPVACLSHSAYNGRKPGR